MNRLLRPAASVWRDRAAEILSPAYGRYSDLVVERARGAHLYTVDDRDVLDLGCGIGVTNLGHNHPAVVKAVHEQVDKLWHTSVTALHPLLIDAAAALAAVAPPGLDQVFLTNSGAEAVESAIKLSRKATGRSEIIAFVGAFHGRTYGAISLTASKAKYRKDIGPFLPGVHHVRYADCFHYCSHPVTDACPIAEGEDLELLFRTRVSPADVAAIVVEPIQGEGGFIVPPRGFLPRLREICDEHGILLVCDEVQSGFGRSGKFFAVEHSGVIPDIMCVAKAFANGLPLAAIVANHKTMDVWSPGEHGTTFGGNPVSCAAAVAVIETMQKEQLPQRAAILGKKALARMQGWRDEFPLIGDVRGLGFMLALEFGDGVQPATAFCQGVQRRCVANDVLVLTCGSGDNVIRIMPPLTIEEAELDHGLDVLEAAIRSEAAGEK